MLQRNRKRNQSPCSCCVNPLHFFAFGRAAVFEQLAHTPGRLVASAASKAILRKPISQEFARDRLLSVVGLRSSAAKPALPASVFASRRRGARFFCGAVPVSSRYLGRDYVP